MNEASTTPLAKLNQPRTNMNRHTSREKVNKRGGGLGGVGGGVGVEDVLLAHYLFLHHYVSRKTGPHPSICSLTELQFQP